MVSASPGTAPNRIPVDKSPALAVFLALFLGPLGLLYVKVVPGLILSVATVAAYVGLGVHSKLALAVLIVAWIVSIVWACVEAPRRHRDFERWRASTGTQGVPSPGARQAAALAYFPGQDAPLPPPGWYPDAADQTKVRWWDGRQWIGDPQVPAQAPPSGPQQPPDRPSAPPGS